MNTTASDADTRAMNQIQTILNGQEWSADTADQIATVVSSTGRTIVDLPPDGESE